MILIFQHAVVSSLDELIRLLTSDEWRKKTHEIFNIGGRQIYKVMFLLIVHLISHNGCVIQSAVNCARAIPQLP